jgi:Uma2 family endonuclease
MEWAASPRRRRGNPRGPWAFVVRDPTPDEASAPVDWSSWYLTDEEDMGQSVEQGDIIRDLCSSLDVLAKERSFANVLVASDNFFAWVPSEPLVRVSPDVYLLDDPPPPPRPRMWQTWLPGHKPPRWAVEIVSEDWRKDYDDAPDKYAQLGTRELIIFDPGAALSDEPREPRVALQVYRRRADGAFVRVYSGVGPAPSAEIAAFLVAQREGDTVRLRIARDAAGTEIVPTAEEGKLVADTRAKRAEERTRIAEEARLASDQRARIAEEKARALEAELARLRRGA